MSQLEPATKHKITVYLMSLLFKTYFRQQNWYEVQNRGKMEKQKSENIELLFRPT